MPPGGRSARLCRVAFMPMRGIAAGPPLRRSACGQMCHSQLPEPRDERQSLKFAISNPTHRVRRAICLRPYGPTFDLHVEDESDRMKSHRLPDQDCDVRYHVQHVAYSCHESGFFHELPHKAFPRTLAEPQATTRQPPRARDPRGRRGPHQKDFVVTWCHSIGGDALAVFSCRHDGDARRGRPNLRTCRWSFNHVSGRRHSARRAGRVRRPRAGQNP